MEPWKGRFGSWRDRWERAKREPAAPAASAAQPVPAEGSDAPGSPTVVASQPEKEYRQADDGYWYSEEQFKEHYKQSGLWHARWERATRDPTAPAASAAQRVPPEGSAAPAHDVPPAASAAEPVK